MIRRKALTQAQVDAYKNFCALSRLKAGYAERAAEFAPPAEEGDTADESSQQIRNISRLSEYDYKKLHGIPDVTPYDDHHGTLRWRRRQVGLYGTNCGVDPALCFTTKEEMDDLKAYEAVAFDKTIEQIREEAQLREARELEERRLREQRTAENLKKTAAWKAEIRGRMDKKEAEMSEAKKKRERILEEVRRHFGYTIDFRDEKFQIMLELKEQELKKQAKLEKKKKKEEHFMKQLASLESGSAKHKKSEGEKADGKNHKSESKVDTKTDTE